MKWSIAAGLSGTGPKKLEGAGCLVFEWTPAALCLPALCVVLAVAPAAGAEAIKVPAAGAVGPPVVPVAVTAPVPAPAVGTTLGERRGLLPLATLRSREADGRVGKLSVIGVDVGALGGVELLVGAGVGVKLGSAVMATAVGVAVELTELSGITAVATLTLDELVEGSDAGRTPVLWVEQRPRHSAVGLVALICSAGVTVVPSALPLPLSWPLLPLPLSWPLLPWPLPFPFPLLLSGPVVVAGWVAVVVVAGWVVVVVVVAGWVAVVVVGWVAVLGVAGWVAVVVVAGWVVVLGVAGWVVVVAGWVVVVVVAGWVVVVVVAGWVVVAGGAGVGGAGCVVVVGVVDAGGGVGGAGCVVVVGVVEAGGGVVDVGAGVVDVGGAGAGAVEAGGGAGGVGGAGVEAGAAVAAGTLAWKAFGLIASSSCSGVRWASAMPASFCACT